jgi:uncharacterized membrane protein
MNGIQINAYIFVEAEHRSFLIVRSGRLRYNTIKDQPPLESLPTATETPSPNSVPRSRAFRARRALLILAFIAVLLVGLLATPPGLLGKADAIGYAVCHRIDLRSFHLGERQLPLCARCTGTFLGVIVGVAILILAGRGRSATWPSRKLFALLVATAIPWGFDGVNSYLSLLPNWPHLYTPQNWLRLTTGTFLGLAMAAIFLPAVNQSLWKNSPPDPVLKNFRELALYFLAAPVLIALVLVENPIILYPLALLSVAGILFLLTGVYTSLLLMLFRKENAAENFHDAWPVLLAGLTIGLLQILAIDAVRFYFTHTWGGFNLGG